MAYIHVLLVSTATVTQPDYNYWDKFPDCVPCRLVELDEILCRLEAYVARIPVNVHRVLLF